MQRSGIVIDEALKNGLRPEASAPRNSPYLVELQNARVGPTGIEPSTEIVQPLNTEVSWPFPALVKLQREWLLFYEDEIFRVDSSDWSKSRILTASPNLSWHFADFHNYVVLANGSKVYDRDPNTGTYSENTSFPKFKTCCNFRGQLIVANIFSDFYDCDETYVAWSNIGHASFEVDRKNEAGYAPADCGEIFKALPLETGVVFYGADGITAFRPAGNQFSVFAKKKLTDFGIASRDAVGGDQKRHIFMDDSGDLWMIDAEFQVQRLGYSEFLGEMLGEDVVVSFNERLGEFFISDGRKSFSLYKGLAEVSEMPTWLNWYNGSLVGVFGESGVSGFKLTLHETDFSWGGIKRLESIELGVDCDSQIYAATDWRSDTSNDWRQTPWVRLNSVGSGVPRVRAKDFRLKLKVEGPALVNLDWIRLWFKMDDQRFARGHANDS